MKLKAERHIRLFAVIAATGLMTFLFYRSHLANTDAAAWTSPSLAGAAFPGQGRLFLTSLALAAGATVMGLILAFPVGLWLGRSGATRLAPILLVPLFIAAHLSAYIWRFTLEDATRAFFHSGGLWAAHWTSFLGAAWTLAAVYWPLVALPLALALRLRGNRIEEELATLAPPRPVFWRAVVPGLAPALCAGAGMLFLFALANYGVPLMWNIPTQTVAVFGRLAATYQSLPAFVLSLPLQITVLCVCALALLHFSRRPYALDLTHAAPGRSRPRPSSPLALCSAGVILLTIGAPFISLLTCPGVFTRLRLGFLEGLGPYKWGLMMAAAGATGAVLLGAVLASVSRRAGRAAQVLIEAVGLTALFLPAVIFCIGLTALAAAPPWLGAVTDTFAVFLLAYGVRFFYLPYKLVRVFHTTESAAYRDLEQMLGLGPCQRLRLAVGGLLRPALCAGWLLVFALTLGELEIAGLHVQAGRQPISIFLENLMHYGRSSTVVQWSLLLILTEIILALIMFRIGWPQWRRLSVTN